MWTPRAEMVVKGIRAIKAQRHPKMSFIPPPTSPPKPSPAPKTSMPKPYQSPLCRVGTRSVATNEEMAFNPPAPIPAATRPMMRASFDIARPQIAFPSAKINKQAIKTDRRPKMSESFPVSGCEAATAIKYAVPSQEMTVSELNSDAIVADTVDVIVVSVVEC
jgi:hypothetical protein